MQFKPGQKLYRFEFKFGKNEVHKTEVNVVDVWPAGNAMLIKYKPNGRMQTSSFYTANVGKVTPRNSACYVVIAEDDVEKARRIVRKHLKERADEERAALRKIEKNIKLLEQMTL